jgi:NAD(P)-dependent dehydrogenase (short-subunit alcohol dehydrogenase family)
LWIISCLIQPVAGGKIVIISSGASKMNLEKMSPVCRAALLDANLTMESLETLIQSFLASWDRHFEENSMPKLCPDQGWWLQVLKFSHSCDRLAQPPLCSLLSFEQAYGFSKAAINAYTVMLARKASGRAVNACMPGFVQTDMTRGYAGVDNLISPTAGAATPLQLCCEDLNGVTGALWKDGKVVPWFP